MNRYVGIFQTVDVEPDAEYLLTLHGMVRSDEGDIDVSDYGYRMQYGLDFNGGSNWQSPDVTWFELTWDEQPRAEAPEGGYRMETYTSTVTARNAQMTLFIGGWKKWIGAGEGDYNVDGVSLVKLGESTTVAPTDEPESATPETEVQDTPVMPQTGEDGANRTVMLVVNIGLLVILAGGVGWALIRRRA
jgi:hypothetical protein